MADPKQQTQQAEQTKMQQAVAKATGVGAPVVIPTEVKAMMKPYDPAEVTAQLATGKYEAAPEVFNIEAGHQVTGILEGYGAPAEFTDANTGEVKEVNTWVLRDPTGTLRISILSSVQLDKKLPGFIGSEVTIIRKHDVNIGNGRRMTPYHVFGPKLPGGRSRKWFDQPALEASSQPMLPAGEQNGQSNAS